MKYFGTVSSFDTSNGRGQIKTDVGGDMLPFERSALAWKNDPVPTVGQRLSYDRGTNSAREPCALNLQTI